MGAECNRRLAHGVLLPFAPVVRLLEVIHSPYRIVILRPIVAPQPQDRLGRANAKRNTVLESAVAGWANLTEIVGEQGIEACALSGIHCDQRVVRGLCDGGIHGRGSTLGRKTGV